MGEVVSALRKEFDMESLRQRAVRALMTSGRNGALDGLADTEEYDMIKHAVDDIILELSAAAPRQFPSEENLDQRFDEEIAALGRISDNHRLACARLSAELKDVRSLVSRSLLRDHPEADSADDWMADILLDESQWV